MSSEQPLDTGAFRRTVRRYRVWVVLAVVLAAVAAGAGITTRPPSWTSTSQVLLPPPPTTSSGQSSDRDPDTYVAVARSQAVLGPVRRTLDTDLTLRQLAKRLDVSAPSSDVIAIKASGPTQGGAERLARAVARALVRYLQDAASSLSNAQMDSLKARAGTLSASLRAVRVQITAARQRAAADGKAPAGAGGADGTTGATTGTDQDARATADALAQLTAQEAQLVLDLDAVRKQQASGVDPDDGAITNQARVIQDASPADRLPMPVYQAGAALLGGALGLVLALLAVGLLRRRRRQLWSRDALADAVGTPVLASVRSRTPRTVGGWDRLLGGYEPGAVDAWALRQLVREHLIGPEAEHLRMVTGPRTRRVLVLGFSDDPAATAVAAQVASYAAATGVTTRFVLGQRHEAVNRLWAACAAAEDGEGPRPDLRVATARDDAHDPHDPADEHLDRLEVVLAVVERKRPVLDAALSEAGADLTLVALSPGTATGEELARTAVAVDVAGLRLSGLLVADADDQEATGCRIARDRRGPRRAQPVQPGQPVQPVRVPAQRDRRDRVSAPAPREVVRPDRVDAADPIDPTDPTDAGHEDALEEQQPHQAAFSLDEALDRGATVIPVAGRRRRTS